MDGTNVNTSDNVFSNGIGYENENNGNFWEVVFFVKKMFIILDI